MRLIYIAPLPLPQRNPIDSTSDSKKLWIFSKARHIGSALSNKFLRSWICGISKSFVGSKLGQNLHRWHCGFSNTEDLKWMWSRVTLPLIWVLRSCLKTLESPVQRRIEQIMGIYNTGCFFYWSALKMTKCQTLRKFWHFFDGIYNVIWHLVIFWGIPVKNTTL